MTDAELEALVTLGEGITPHDRALRTIAEQGTDLTLEQVTGQRNLWIMGASEWEARLVEAQAALTTLRKQRDELREALRPFARIGDKLLSVNGWGDEDKITVDLSHSFDVLERLEVQAFRAARQALSNMEELRNDHS